MKSELRKVLIEAMDSKICFASQSGVVGREGTLPPFNVVEVDDISSIFYMGHLQMN